MTYAIIGSGAIGTALASQFARNNIDVLVTNSRGAAAVSELAEKLGNNIKPVSVGGASDWAGRVVIDATNAIDFPAFTPKDLGGRLSTEIVAESVPGARVVKAFNTLPAAVLAADPVKDGGHRVVFLSGNDAEANKLVVDLAGSLRFSAINLESLVQGRLAQFGGPLMVHNLTNLA